MNGTILLAFDHRTAARLLSVIGFTGLLLSTAGAFDTEAARFWPRLGYWLAIALVSIVALEASHRTLRRCLPHVAKWPLRALGLILLVLPLTAFATLGCKLLFGGWPTIGGFTHLLPGMSAILATLQFVLSAFNSSPAAVPAAQAPADPLTDLLPLPFRSAQIHALEAEDHYVRVHASTGQALVRMRFADALAAVAQRRGVQPHRSWWVAEDSLLSMRRVDGRTVIRLVNGLEVPVSRRARPLLGPLFDRHEAREAAE